MRFGKVMFPALGIQSLWNRSTSSATQSYIRGWGGCGSCVALVLFLLSCSSIRNVRRETPTGEVSAIPPRYSIVCIIHGDGDYLYHDSHGKALRADAVALGKVKMVAVNNPEAEVFIFHERRRKHAWLFFPLRDGKFYYYRNGRLHVEEEYRRDKGKSHFATQVELYNRFHVEVQPEVTRFFLYFGHEVPESGGAGYDASYSKRKFTVHDLADGLGRITRDSTKFDLIVLSTCSNGTPYTIAALAPYARYIIASPGDLHLSHFDLNSFEGLDVGLREGDMSAFAKKFARQAFDRLISDVQTEVTVAVYDVSRVRGFLHSVDRLYDYDLSTLKGVTPTAIEHCDCAEESEYVLPEMNEGVEVFYRPPLFGRSKHKQNHSGWECRRLIK